MTFRSSIIARVDADAVQELLDMRADYTAEVRVLGLAPVADICFKMREISAEALALAEQLDRDPLAILDYQDVAPFSDAFPALDRWKAIVLKKPRHQRDRLEAAAAHEVQAVEAERVGALDAADLARQAAAAALRSRRRSA